MQCARVGRLQVISALCRREIKLNFLVAIYKAFHMGIDHFSVLEFQRKKKKKKKRADGSNM